MRRHTSVSLLAFVATILSLANATNDLGTFSNPASRARPRFRYWLPDASVDAEVISDDIASAAHIGAGGVEFLPFYEYGGSIGQIPQGADWSTYGFGTPAYVDLFKKALETHNELGLVMDFALGPNQGQGVPATPDTEGLQWDLFPITEQLPRNGSFSGELPGWGTGKLVSCVTARVLSQRKKSYVAPGLGGVGSVNVTYDEYLLDHESLLERTEDVDATDGHIGLHFSPPMPGTHYRLFAFYERLTGHKNLQFNSTRDETIFDNGSYTVDHFDPEGASVVIDFWEEHILKDGVPELLAKAGNYAWEDSIEMESNISWSRSLPDRFQKAQGYSIKPYLPLVTFKQNNIGLQADAPGTFKCILDTEDEGAGYINSFHETLLAGYKEYVETLTAWAHDVLGTQVSNQPAYNMPMDMQAAVPLVDAPECESLGFDDSIDSYRQFTGPAYLSGTRVVSNELGAVMNSALSYNIPRLIFSANRGFAGGVNQYVIHGQAYTGTYFNTTWPGHTPFDYLFSAPWSKRLPTWSHGLSETLEYMGRMQYLHQNGVPKIDVAIYNKESATTISDKYQPSDLLAEGWSYNYLSPDNLGLSQANVKDGVLAPDGPAWKALVIEGSQNATLQSIQTLKTFADEGLPIIISGGPPGYYPEDDGSNKDKFESQLSDLTRRDNVHSVPTGGVANRLAALGLRPQVQTNTTGTWYTTWRESEETGYAVVYADMTPSSGSVRVASTQTPYYLNPWTGETFPVLIYERTNSTTIIPVSLAGNQTVVFAFSDKLRDEIPALWHHITKAPSNVLGSRFVPDRGIEMHVASSNSSSNVELSNGTRIVLDGTSVPSAFQLPSWSLTAEHWEAPRNLSAALPTVKRNTTHHLDSPTSWSEIPALANTSGVGYYETTFHWPPKETTLGAASTGAYLSLSKVVDAIQVDINGQRIPPLDVTNAVANISPYLEEGVNTISITVPTTMWNYIRTILRDLLTAGSEPLPIVIGTPLEPRTEAGLVGTVEIIPYMSVTV